MKSQFGGLADTARAENEACENVVREVRAFFAQHGAPEAALHLLDEVAGRVSLRRLLTPKTTPGNPSGAEEKDPKTVK